MSRPGHPAAVVHFIGAGPGAPDLLTLRAAAVIAEGSHRRARADAATRADETRRGLPDAAATTAVFMADRLGEHAVGQQTLVLVGRGALLSAQ